MKVEPVSKRQLAALAQATQTPATHVCRGAPAHFQDSADCHCDGYRTLQCTGRVAKGSVGSITTWYQEVEVGNYIEQL